MKKLILLTASTVLVASVMTHADNWQNYYPGSAQMQPMDMGTMPMNRQGMMRGQQGMMMSPEMQQQRQAMQAEMMAIRNEQDPEKRQAMMLLHRAKMQQMRGTMPMGGGQPGMKNMSQQKQ